MTDNPQQPIWERLPSDTDKSYEAFCIYRDMGVHRSLRKAGIEYYGKPTVNLRYIEEWSSSHDWVNRVTAYDAHMQSARNEAIRNAQTEIQEDALSDYRELRRAVDKRLELFATEGYVAKPHELNDMVNMLKNLNEYVRLNVGLPDRITENNNKNNTTHSGSVTLLSELSDDDLDNILED